MAYYLFETLTKTYGESGFTPRRNFSSGKMMGLESISRLNSVSKVTILVPAASMSVLLALIRF